MSKLDQMATAHMRTEDVYESETIRVERAYIAGFRAAQLAATEAFVAWNEVTGALPKGTSWYYELIGCIHEPFDEEAK